MPSRGPPFYGRETAYFVNSTATEERRDALESSRRTRAVSSGCLDGADIVRENLRVGPSRSSVSTTSRERASAIRASSYCSISGFCRTPLSAIARRSTGRPAEERHDYIPATGRRGVRAGVIDRGHHAGCIAAFASSLLCPPQHSGRGPVSSRLELEVSWVSCRGWSRVSRRREFVPGALGPATAALLPYQTF